MADETARTRILTLEEEIRLLEACDCDQRRHLRALVVCLLDTGLRLNEALTLTWDHVDLDNGLVSILAFNSKTATPRTVPVSGRLRRELERLLNERKMTESLKGDARVFGIANNVNRSWRTARKLADLDDVRIHDLRHTFGTRLDRSGFTQAQIARSLGHKQVHTTFRYTNPDQDLLADVRNAVESFHGSPSEAIETESIN